jgi:hypothetical protein
MVKHQNRVNDRQAMCPAPPAAIGRTASLHVSLTITARALGTPQHQAASVSSEAQRLLDGLCAIASEFTDADEISAYIGHLHAPTARQDANGAHSRMTIMK